MFHKEGLTLLLLPITALRVLGSRLRHSLRLLQLFQEGIVREIRLLFLSALFLLVPLPSSLLAGCQVLQVTDVRLDLRLISHLRAWWGLVYFKSFLLIRVIVEFTSV